MLPTGQSRLTAGSLLVFFHALERASPVPLQSPLTLPVPHALSRGEGPARPGSPAAGLHCLFAVLPHPGSINNRSGARLTSRKLVKSVSRSTVSFAASSSRALGSC